MRSRELPHPSLPLAAGTTILPESGGEVVRPPPPFRLSRQAPLASTQCCTEGARGVRGSHSVNRRSSPSERIVAMISSATFAGSKGVIESWRGVTRDHLEPFGLGDDCRRRGPTRYRRAPVAGCRSGPCPTSRGIRSWCGRGSNADTRWRCQWTLSMQGRVEGKPVSRARAGAVVSGCVETRIFGEQRSPGGWRRQWREAVRSGPDGG